MKWLYRIFRLFKCPHKWAAFETHKIVNQVENKTLAVVDTLKCRRCGDLVFRRKGLYQ